MPLRIIRGGALPTATAEDAAVVPPPVEDDEIIAPPVFPHHLAWRPPLDRYLAGVGPYTESPDEFHFASIIAVCGLLAGRALHIPCPSPHFPNFFVCLTGPTAVRKSEAMKLAKHHVLMPELSAAPPGAIVIKHGVTSGEGLLQGLADEGGGEGGRRALLYVPEMSTLMAKMRQGIGNTLGSLLLQAADAEATMDITTRRSSITVTGALVSMVTASTPEWVESEVTDTEIRGGWVNRILWFYNEGGKPAVPMADKLGHDELRLFRAELRQCIHLQYMRHTTPITMTTEAYKVWDVWYRTRFQDRPASKVVASVTARRTTHALKLAVLYAALDKLREVTPEHVEAATAVADYCAASAAYLFSSLSSNPAARANREVVRYLQTRRRKGDIGACRITTVQKVVAPEMDSNAFLQQLRSMVATGAINADWGRKLIWATSDDTD